MNDEQMDARLQQAGESWRAATADVSVSAAPEVHPLTPSGGSRTPRRRTGLFASAAVVAAALVAGGSLLVANITRDDGNRGTEMSTASLEGTVWGLVGWDG